MPEIPFHEGALKNDLRRLFAQHGVMVMVGHQEKGGVYIVSEDERVDACNITIKDDHAIQLRSPVSGRLYGIAINQVAGDEVVEVVELEEP